MDFINVGGNNFGSAVPMSCMCSSKKGFVNARGSDDSCLHCGCSCKLGSNTNAANSTRARLTVNHPGFFDPE